MRTARCVTLVVLLLTIVLSVQAESWESLRQRPGNDDLFVLVDTSRPAAERGSLLAAKVFMQDLFTRYVKEGDRVVVMTFDSDARVHGVFWIEKRNRDVELVREIVDGIDVRRAIRYRGMWPALTEAPDGQWTGGSAFADYCEMWRLAARVLRAYSTPSRRRLLFVFTDGASPPPEYRPCHDARPPLSIVEALREGTLRLGIIAPARSSAHVGFSPQLRGIASDLSGKGIASASVIELREGRGREEALRRVADLLSARVDLTSPDVLRLRLDGAADARMPLEVVNRSSVRRDIVIRAASLRLPGDPALLPVRVTPARLTIEPERMAVMTLSIARLPSKPGRYRGEIVLEFQDGARFDPAVLPLELTQRTWLDGRGQAVTGTLLGGIVLLSSLCLWLTYDRRRVSARFTAAPPAEFRRDPRS
jgi:hypothetical protein